MSCKRNPLYHFIELMVTVTVTDCDCVCIYQCIIYIYIWIFFLTTEYIIHAWRDIRCDIDTRTCLTDWWLMLRGKRFNVFQIPNTSVWRHRKWYTNELNLSLSLITSTKKQYCPEVWSFLNFTVHNYNFLDVYCLSWCFPLDPGDPGPCNPKGCL